MFWIAAVLAGSGVMPLVLMMCFIASDQQLVCLVGDDCVPPGCVPNKPLSILANYYIKPCLPIYSAHNLLEVFKGTRDAKW